MQTPGAFCWWYADLVDDHGDGVVLIWSFGLPFLPQARKRRTPAGRPALNVVMYRRHREEFYLLQELGPAEAAFSSRLGFSSWRLGETRITSCERDGRVVLDAAVDAPVPASASRLTGRVQLHGPRVRVGRRPLGARGDDVHVWAPHLAGSAGVAELEWGDDVARVSGRGYFDANASAKPLHELGISAWRWGRVGIGGRELVFYDVQPEDGDALANRYVFVVEPDGAMRMQPAPTLEWRRPRRSLYGLTHHRELHVMGSDLDVSVRFDALVDDGPFYQRSLASATCLASGATGHGTAELVVPPRVDLPWQRPFVRMRRHAVNGDNSMWLPLFSGCRRGRIGRLVSQLWSPWPRSSSSRRSEERA
jgi:hypothetical protein